MKKSSVSCTQRSTYFLDSVLCLERWTRTQNQILLGKKSWVDSEVHHNRETWTVLMVSQWNSSGIFTKIHHIAALQQSPRVTVKIERNTRNSLDGLSSCRCSTTFHVNLKTINEQECESSAQLVSLYAKRFGAGQWSFLGLGSEKKWYSTSEDSPQGEWDRIAEQMMLTFAECQHPVFRSTSPLSRGQLKSKGGGKRSIHFCADGDTIETVFRTSISVNQSSIHGAISDLCEEDEACHVRTERLVLAGVLRRKGGGKLSIHYCVDPGTIETVFRTIISVN